MARRCYLYQLEESWNCEWVKDPEHPAVDDHCDTEPTSCLVEITIDRHGQIVPFFPELEKQCLIEEFGVVRKSASYDEAYAEALREYEQQAANNPRTGNTIVCYDEERAQMDALFDIIVTTIEIVSD